MSQTSEKESKQYREEIQEQEVSKSTTENSDENIEGTKEVNWQEEAEKNLNGWKRAQADYQNLKKQSEQEKLEIRKYGAANIIEELIPVFDNFALAIKHCPEELTGNAWVQGILYIEQQWAQILSEQGVEVVTPKAGEDFDPQTQEAIETKENAEGKVEEVVQNGYQIHGRVIRPARVKVS
jgi:molecular chaperone GrpE